jgi:TonB family protein
LLVAAAAHTALVALAAWAWHTSPASRPDPGFAEPAPTAARDVAIVELISGREVEPGPPLAVVPGPGDWSSFDPVHPLPRADVDLPGAAAAVRGGGSEPGRQSFTGRRDTDTARAEVWNQHEGYRIARRQTADTQASPEAMSRDPRPRSSDRRSIPSLAREGTSIAQAGEIDARGVDASLRGVPHREWDDVDPLFDAEPAPSLPARRDGATRVRRDRPLVGAGERAVESDRRGRVSDRLDMAAASDETDPAPLELSRPSAGGRAQGGIEGTGDVAGVSSSGVLGGRGSAATRAAARRGAGRLAVRADRQIEYFRRMYERIDALVIYPRELALALEQGLVIITFTLHRDGHISDVTVAKSSGFKEFDGEVRRALLSAAPFGAVPESIRGADQRITVKAPYTFSNPVIR